MSYNTRLEAVKASVDLGAEVGAHESEDGGWLPCKSTEEYQKALNRKFEKSSDNKESDESKFVKSQETSKVCKVDGSRRLVFGWAQVCTKNGEDYYDTDNQCFPEDVTLGDVDSGWVNFMRQSRIHKAMHSGQEVGDVVFAFPAFDDIMKSLGFEPANQTGIITGVYVSDDDILAKFHKGEYTGFSVGGRAAWIDEE